MNLTFNTNDYSEFHYVDFSLKNNVLSMHYKLVGNKTIEFTEEITMPLPDVAPTKKARDVANRLARLIFLVAGPSYFKAAAPKLVRIFPAISIEELHFTKDLYFSGLTEFAYINKMPEALEPTFKTTKVIDQQPIILQPREGLSPLVPIGGGKDSSVTIEALRSAGFDSLLFSQNTFPPQKRSAQVAKLPYIIASRKIDSKILDLHNKGAYNGHIPITTLVSLVSLLTAVLWGRGTVIMSNERSADVGSILWQGIEVNHQSSKNLAAEQKLRNILQAVVADDLEYFSLLRPFSELRITRQFAKLKKYHSVFTSCNRVFRLVEKNRAENWCGNCDKCRFVFLALAPYLSRKDLETIFNGNLLAEPTQTNGFRELLGILGHKPLDCVGEIEESRAALKLIASNPQWQDVGVIAEIKAEIPNDAWPTERQMEELFTTDTHHFIPKEYQGALNAIN